MRCVIGLNKRRYLSIYLSIHENIGVMFLMVNNLGLHTIADATHPHKQGDYN